MSTDANAGGSGATTDDQKGQGQGQGAAGAGGSAAGSGSSALTFETWSTGWTDEQKALHEQHTTGLKSALNTERDARKALEKQLKDLQGKAEKGSELEKQLGEISTKLQAAERSNAIITQLTAAGVSNLELATIAVQSKDLFKRDGVTVDIDELKKGFPELFAKPAAGRGDAGAGGTATAGDSKSQFNSWLRGN